MPRGADDSQPSALGLEQRSMSARDVALVPGKPSLYDDEMLSWLQFPLEDTLDSIYCSEISGGPIPHVQLVKDGFLQQSLRESETSQEGDAGPNIKGMASNHVGLRQLVSMIETHCPGVLNSDAAMAMGAGRAAGLITQTGSDVFYGVRTAASAPKSLLTPTEQRINGQKSFDALDPVMNSLLDMKKSPMLSPAPLPISSQPVQHRGSNFSLFSQPVTTTLDSLRLVGAASGPTNVERARQPLFKDLSPSRKPSVGDSNCSVVMSMRSCQQSTELPSQDRGATEGSSYRLPDWSNLSCRQDVGVRNETLELIGHVTGLPRSIVSVSENMIGTNAAMETTVSPSRMSGSSPKKMPEEAVATTPKKKSLVKFSEDVEEVTAYTKKPPPAPRASKRSRTAETHNECEKKRRDKINVKLKALQSLIPNSNKTDKASVLDEAIEYTKMLQAQVQVMSMQTGMFLPAMVMPAGMHYPPVQQMQTLSCTGISMGVGLGINITDAYNRYTRS